MNKDNTPVPRDPASRGGGYRKPPVKNQFKKSRSGNPKGRPKKVRPEEPVSTPLFADAADIFNEQIEITERGRKKKVPLRVAVLRRYIQMCAKSDDPKVLSELIKLMEKTDRAVSEGRGNEPLRIIVEGGLPDNEPREYAPDSYDDRPTSDTMPLDGTADKP